MLAPPALCNPPPCAESPIISLGTVFNACVRHTPCHNHSSTVPNPRARLALPVLFNPRVPRCPQTYVQHRHKDTLIPP